MLSISRLSARALGTAALAVSLGLGGVRADIPPGPPPSTTAAPPKPGTGTIVIHVEPLGSQNGNVLSMLFSDEGAFPGKAEKSSARTFTTAAAVPVTLRFENIPFGTYAFTVFHDENANGKLDTRIFGIPKEPVGVSNNARGRFGPKWKDAKFELREPLKEMTVKLVRIGSS